MDHLSFFLQDVSSSDEDDSSDNEVEEPDLLEDFFGHDTNDGHWLSDCHILEMMEKSNRDDGVKCTKLKAMGFLFVVKRKL